MALTTRDRAGSINDLIHTKDPRGLVQKDIDYLKSVFKAKPIKPSMSHNEIMFHAGQMDVIRHIEEVMVK